MRARVSLGRISSFLADGEELDQDDPPERDDTLAFRRAEFSWRNVASHWRLQVDDLEFETGRLTVIGGPVGSGKTALLYAILGEMHCVAGELALPYDGPIAYAAQGSWLQNRSIRENVLFGERFDQKRYDTAIYEAALADDIERLKEGDHTVVGERVRALPLGAHD